jgi:inhibitor of KinA sporulation pathway (predicted exonuclease)
MERMEKEGCWEKSSFDDSISVSFVVLWEARVIDEFHKYVGFIEC